MTVLKGTKMVLSAFFSLKPTCSAANPMGRHKTHLALSVVVCFQRQQQYLSAHHSGEHTLGLSLRSSDKRVFFLSFNRFFVLTMFHSLSMRIPAFSESDVYRMT